jgi:hypothetical protein
MFWGILDVFLEHLVQEFPTYPNYYCCNILTVEIKLTPRSSQTPLPIQIRIMAHVASQYLPALLEYQYSDTPHLHDPSSSQYWCSDAFTLINWLTSDPDVAVTVAKHPSLFHDTVEKLLNPNILTEMKVCPRNGGSSFEAEFASLLQFVSTILLRKEHLPTPPHPRINELVPKLKAWKRKYSGQFIARVSERLADQIKSPESLDLGAVLNAQNGNLVCGYIQCEKKTDLNACARCKMQRYCSAEHQKKDWGFHKGICGKGLLDE